jgi:hypothetical protein
MTINPSDSFDPKYINAFSETTKAYFGKEKSIVKIDGCYAYIEGWNERIYKITLYSIAMFYKWRMKNSKYHNIQFDDYDYEYMEQLLSTKILNYSGIGYVLEVSQDALRKNYSVTNSIKTSVRKIKNGHGKAQSARVFPWKDKNYTAAGWAKFLSMSVDTWRNRFYKHGICKLSFMTKEKYSKVSKQERDKYVNTEERNKCITDNNLVDNSTDYFPVDKNVNAIKHESLIKLIVAIIKDSKDNIINDNKISRRYKDDSERFLLNKNGMLQYYLEYTNISNVDLVLNKLEQFVIQTKEKHEDSIN